MTLNFSQRGNLPRKILRRRKQRRCKEVPGKESREFEESKRSRIPPLRRNSADFQQRLRPRTNPTISLHPQLPGKASKKKKTQLWQRNTVASLLLVRVQSVLISA